MASETTTLYDSTADTLQHIEQVRWHLTRMVVALNRRGQIHDASKLREPEKSVFDRVTPLLRDLTYGSDEYNASLADMKVALDHHYAHNRHHPQFHENGVDGMTLIDIVEMLCDWRAATERHADGSLAESLRINRERFGLSDQLYNILVNTAREFGWVADTFVSVGTERSS